ncbi:MAG: IS110 family transposase [Bacteroidetes bacterium]|nr:MAG: IS110 family transposase [Bacteroidota bacterium]TAH41764.1 MAG: IS110 family transposase [Bacteroidota bacterium]
MKKKSEPTTFPVLFPNAAGIDIGSKEHYVAVRPDIDPNPVRSFGTFTDDLIDICEWLDQCGVTTVAMEATGVYWVSLYLLLEQRGVEVVLVNARHVKNVRGKKTDVSDADWIRQLHSCGLLSASFQPDAFTRELRAYMRHRKNLIEMSASHILMIQKGFEQMNIKLHLVLTDITGKSGQAIIKAIINGERNIEKLYDLVDQRVKAKRDDILKALRGNWKEEHLFQINQSYEGYLFYRRMIEECDKKIEELLKKKTTYKSHPEIKEKNPRSNLNNLNFNASTLLAEITGIDLTKIFGIRASTAIEIISEVGLDLNKWPTEKHFTSWLNLSPNNKKTGGKVISSRTRKKKNKAGQAFKAAANAIQRSKHWLASFYQRIKQKGGAGKAITATARKLAIIFYRMLKNKVEFNPIPIEVYSQMYKEQKIRKLKSTASRLGFNVIERERTQVT